LQGKVGEKIAAGAADGAHGVPLFLLQLVDTLCREQLKTVDSAPEEKKTSAPTTIGRAAALHGVELLRSGYSIDQVVHDYGDICQSVTELAAEQNAPVTVAAFSHLQPLPRQRHCRRRHGVCKWPMTQSPTKRRAGKSVLFRRTSNDD